MRVVTYRFNRVMSTTMRVVTSLFMRRSTTMRVITPLPLGSETPTIPLQRVTLCNYCQKVTLLTRAGITLRVVTLLLS